MRIGTMLAEPDPSDPIGSLRAKIEAARDTGFASAWLANIFGVEAITALSVAGHAIATGGGGIELGTAVVPTYPRHPAVMAQHALTAQAALGGRFSLGIGLSHQIVIEGMYGYSYDKPARHMREYLSVLVPLLREGNVSFEGEHFTAKVGLSVSREPQVPVLLAALAPQMLKLAGSVADGTILWMTGPDTVASHVVPTLTAAADAAGRPAPRVVCALPVAVTDDPDAARAKANKVYSIYGQLPSYRAMLDREGAAGPGDVAIVGDEATVTAEIRRLGDVGVTDFTYAPISADDARTDALLSELANA